MSSMKKRNAKQDKEGSALIYVGPTFLNLTQYTTYTNGLPTYVKAMIERRPELHSLFLPVEDFPEKQNEVTRTGSELHVAYAAALKTKGV
ncbi:hypothetical protein [Paenibacillus apiarius]|uniref:hypothetical protein n=1 Tax=Paenibacillus apiarius TaxID=46240 RepID=UPI003B3B5FAC